MKTTNSAHSNTSIWLGALFCMELVFCLTFAGCKKLVLWEFDRLEKKALNYGTVSVGAVRVIPYDDDELKKSRENLHNALKNIRDQLTDAPITSPTQIEDSNNKKTVKSQPPWLSEIERVGLRMAALKFVESEIEDINLGTIYRADPNFHRMVVSLDCSAWVRGKAGAALVYIDLYPYKADDWCHEAEKILESWWDEINDCDRSEEPKGRKHYECCWNKVAEDKLTYAFECSMLTTKIQMPNEPDIEDRDSNDWVGFCHRLLAEQKLLPHIVHVERMGRAEYLILAESDYSSSKLGIGFEYPVGPSAEWAAETRREGKRKMESLRQLSLAFVAGNRRAGWLFMPGKTTEGRMAPTERRLRMVVDVPKELKTLAIHVHKVFLGPDLRVIDGAAFSKHVENLDKTKKTLTDADDLFEEYKEKMPSHYRLIKTRMRNLLYQGWPEEFEVDIPKSRK